MLSPLAMGVKANNTISLLLQNFLISSWKYYGWNSIAFTAGLKSQKDKILFIECIL